MLNTLVDMFLRTKFLTNELAKSQQPMAFIHEVLVPEVCISLIQEDYNGISYQKAKKIMNDSCEFGDHLFQENDYYITNTKFRLICMRKL